MSAKWPGAKSDFLFKPFDLDRPGLRLLRLKPARARDTPIECQLVQAFLDEDVIDYEAVSYTWGSVVSLRTIILDGSTFFVPFNLWSLLRDVRQQDQDRVLWVDAVCINQSDARERGHQVQRMSRIYHQAERVIIWLGPLANPSIGSFMDLLVVLQQHTRGVNWPLDDPRWKIQWEKISKGSSDELRSAFVDILQRPWFRRVWIIQEVFNARRALLHCGSKAISAKVFSLCPKLLEIEPGTHCQAILDVMPGPFRSGSWWEKDHRLHTLLRQFSESEATRDHDRIFALLGLCPEANAQITADYNQPISQLLRDTASYILMDNPSPYDIGSLPCFEYDSVKSFMKDIDVLYSRVLEQLLQLGPAHVVDDFIRRFQGQLAITPDLCVAAMTRQELGEQSILSVLAQNPNAPQVEDPQGRTPFMVMSEFKNEAIMKVLVEHGADWKDRKGFAPLRKASELGYEAIVQLLLDRGASYEIAGLDLVDFPLAIACKNGHDTVVRQFLDRRKFSKLDAALDTASHSGHEGIVRLLLLHGAEASTSACFQALQEGRQEIAKILINRGALRSGSLELACRTGNEAVVKFLLDRGAPVPGYVLSAACEGGHEAVVRLLLEQGAPVPDYALSVACERGHVAIVQLLLDKNVSVTDDALEKACGGGHEAVVRLLLDRGAPVTGYLLSAACEGDHEAVVQLLLDQGAPGTEQAPGKACLKGRNAIVRLLLSRGADLESIHFWGRTCLSMASEYGHQDVAQTLLDAGADCNSRGRSGLTPLGWALHKGHKGIEQLLRSRGATDERYMYNIGI